MDPVSLTDLLTATRARASGFTGELPVFRSVSIDSRTLHAGDLFWALEGERLDGHDFAAAALARGASACVVSEGRAAGIGGPLVIVRNSNEALAEFARWYRLMREALVIGITGSVGKTTTREMLYSVLSSRHEGIRSRGNFNNEIGLPLSLLDLASSDEFAAIEMGARRVGDIRRLCEIACPEVGVLTTIGPAHLESFGSLDEIYRGKGELLESLPAHGFAVVAGDDDRMRALAGRAGCRVIFAGERAGNDLRATEIDFVPGRLRFRIESTRYELPAPARHYLTPALGALGVAREIGMDDAAIAEGFDRFANAPGRCKVEQVGDWTLIDDTYNASPLSMQAACLCLRDWPAAGNRLLVAGDMLELGSDTHRCHEELGECVAGTRIDRLLAFGDQADAVVGGALRAGMSPHTVADCHDIDSLLTVLDCWLAPGDVILVKGSRGMRMERIIQWLKQQGELPGKRAGAPRARAVA
jgi:UDP-N-acetylmuramoyl-tripeptide--D-alanyl-D-alanine ligase